jgi:hypothetical protein
VIYLDQLQILALTHLYADLARDSRDGVPEDSFANEMAIKPSKNLLSRALDELKKKNFSHEFFDETDGVSYIIITNKGINFVEKLHAAKDAAVISYLDSFKIKPDFILGDQDSIAIPASDRSVSLNHNQPEYTEAVAALDKVIEEFRSNHRLDNELGHEKEALLSGLEGGRKLLNDTNVSESVAKALIVEPLRRLIIKYDKEIVGAVAATALALFLKLFGL